MNVCILKEKLVFKCLNMEERGDRRLKKNDSKLVGFFNVVIK